MKKSILGLAFLTMAAFAIPAVAQKNDKKAECCKEKTECAAKKECKDPKACKPGKCEKMNPFADLNLTSEQQGRIEALNNAMKVSRKELKEAAKTAKEKKDTTFNPRAAKKQLRTKYVQDLSEILTPEQYTKFLQNYYINNGGNHGKMAKKAGKPGKFDKRGPKDFKGKGAPKGDRVPKGRPSK